MRINSLKLFIPLVKAGKRNADILYCEEIVRESRTVRSTRDISGYHNN